MKRVWTWLKTHPYFSGLLIAFLILAVFFPLSVKQGTITRCYYGEVIKKDISEVFVPWWMRSKYKVKTRWVLCSRHQKAEELYSTWRELIRAGKKKEARFYQEKLEALVGPDWSPSKRIAGGSSSTSKPETTGSGGGSSGNNSGSQNNSFNNNQSSGGGSDEGSTGGEEPGTYSGDLYSLLPVSLEGYEFFLKEEYPLQALAMARPLTDKNVVMVQFSIERVDDSTAKEYLKGFKESYGNDWQEVKVNSSKAYWGKTSDSQEALLTWRRLDLLYVIDLTTRVDAGSYRSKMIEWGNSLF